MKSLICAALVVAVTMAGAQSTTQSELEAQQKADQLDKAMRAADRLMALANDIAAEKRAACMRAVGAAKFCGCLSIQLPVELTFPMYVQVTTGTKEENEYSKLNAKSKKMYDAVPAVRDRCVRESFGVQK
jgi:hypothetical protein